MKMPMAAIDGEEKAVKEQNSADHRAILSVTGLP